MSDIFYNLFFYFLFFYWVGFYGEIRKLVLKVEIILVSFVNVFYIVSEILVILFIKDFRLFEKMVKEMLEVVV